MGPRQWRHTVLLFSLGTYCCQRAHLYSLHARLPLPRVILKLLKFSEVIFVLKLANADFLAFIACLHSTKAYSVSSVLQWFLAILHKISVNKTIGSSYNSIVFNVNCSLHQLSNCAQSVRLRFQRGSASGSETTISETIGK